MSSAGRESIRKHGIYYAKELDVTFSSFSWHLFSSQLINVAMQAIDLDAHWSEIRLRAKEIVAREPALGTLLNETVVERDSFAECLTYRLTRKLVNHSASIGVLHETF
ncbi:MAG: hypothetical protein VXU42_04825, partial [Verrucomicrobiota bacterium]|nr:hypothetical protein [Verrucomicrobiota bacterium]